MTDIFSKIIFYSLSGENFKFDIFSIFAGYFFKKVGRETRA